jgi:hypothetical protein
MQKYDLFEITFFVVRTIIRVFRQCVRGSSLYLQNKQIIGLIIYMTKLLQSDWLRGVQLFH